MSQGISIISLYNFAPEIILSFMAMIILMAGIFKFSEKYVFHITVFSIIAAFFVGMQNYSLEPVLIFNGFLIKNEINDFFKFVCYFIFFVQLLVSKDFVKEKNLYSGEFYSLLVFALIGCLIIISANNLIVLFLGIELSSLSLYSLIALNRSSLMSSEAAAAKIGD